ncbi:SPW repeat protein [Actinacidiphila sp. ITFR-21]|uniref:SPW repeat protein n=1 Tax=Actinacidiphila sp. ITFR-21 TaxID=3075199 RepID=UPI00288C242C|nr:SPW repeat protein [Streptomyces sp. ITFR-21]WNI16095.1 SPW repeat protein [Streptomyces sp. ITFR-21]
MATHSTDTSHIDTHPDLVSLRDRYAAMSDKPLNGLLEGLCVLAGLYLAISPWVVGFQSFSPSLRVSNLITGIALAVLGMGFGSVLERTHGLGWVATAIGAWTIVAPWAVSGSAAFHKTIWNNSFVGGVACLVGLAIMAMGLMASRSRRSGTRTRA